MRVLVTGATGGVGSHTAAALCAAGHEVRVLARDPSRVAEVPALRGVAGVEAVKGDVTDAPSVGAALRGCDAVVHAAALVTLDERLAAEALRVNLEGTRNVVGGAVDAGVERVLHVSSVSLFGFDGTPVSVESPLAEATGGYAESKRRAEVFVRELQDADAPVISTYPSGVYGPLSPRSTITDQGLLLWLIMAPRTSGGTAIVDVRDLARAHVAALERRPGPARWLLGGHFLTWPEAWRALERVTGRRIPFVPMPGSVLRWAGRLGDVVKHVAPFEFPMTYEAMESGTRAAPYDSRPAEEQLGVVFRPAEETLADTIRWLHAQGRLPAVLAGRLTDD